MQIVKVHNQFCNETIYATVRITDAEFVHFKWFMRRCEKPGYKGDAIVFPFGVELVKTGYGWAKLQPTNFVKGVMKMEFAMKRPFQEYEEYLEQLRLEEFRRLTHAEMTRTQVVAYSNAYSSDGEFIFASKQDHKNKRVHESLVKYSNPDVERARALQQVQPEPAQKPVQSLTDHGISKLQRLATKFGHQLRSK